VHTKENEELIKLKKQRQEQTKLIGAENDSIAKLRAENAKLHQARNKVSTATEAGRKKIQSLNAQIDKNNNTIKKNSDAYTKQKINIGNYSSALSGLSPRLGAAVNGVSMFGQSLKALLLNPVVAMIAGLAAAFKFLASTFKRSQDFADSFAVAMSGIRAAVAVIQDRIIQFVKNVGAAFNNIIGIIKTIGSAAAAAAKGQFGQMRVYMASLKEQRKALAEEWVTSTTTIAEEIRKEKAAAEELTASQIALRDAEIDFIEEKARYAREIGKARLAAVDENKTTKERIEQLDIAIGLEEELLQKELSLARERARILTEEAALGESLTDELREAAEARAKVIELEAQSYKRQRTIQSKRLGEIRRMRREEVKITEDTAQDIQKVYQDMEDAIFETLEGEIEKEDELLQGHWQDLTDARALNAQSSYDIMTESIQDEFEVRRAALEAQKQQEIAYAESIGADVAAIQKKYALIEKKIVIDKEIEKYKTIANFAGAVAKLFSENTIAYKALAIAEATISTYVGAANAMKNTPLPPPFPQLAAASVVVAGLAQVSKIVSVSVPEFCKGIDSSPEGPAWIGEKGSELMIDKRGRIGLSPDSPTLSYLESGTKIIPADITKKIIGANVLISQGKQNQAELLLDELRQSNDRLRRELRNKPVASVNINSAGITVMTEAGRNRQQRIDKYFRT